jgi:ADP-dependent NAD(P)H-hydrate dehydratase
VRLAVPGELQPLVAGANPCYMTAPLPYDIHGLLACGAETDLVDLAQTNDVVAIGPGLGRSPAITALVSALLGKVPTPLVVDADGLNALQAHPERFLDRQAFREEKNNPNAAPVIVTPHPGEFARLTGSDLGTVQAHRQTLAVRFAQEHRVILVLKGHGTIVTDGRRVYINTTGNPGLATGGTGDVLTGLIAALLGQKLEPFAAAQLGVHVHGLAGDLARDAVGEVSLIATDVVQYLPAAFLRMQRASHEVGTQSE